MTANASKYNVADSWFNQLVIRARAIAGMSRKALPIKGKRVKPAWKTRIRQKTARHLAYLQEHDLADFSDCNFEIIPKLRVMRPDGVIVPCSDPTHGV